MIKYVIKDSKNKICSRHRLKRVADARAKKLNKLWSAFKNQHFRVVRINTRK